MVTVVAGDPTEWDRARPKPTPKPVGAQRDWRTIPTQQQIKLVFALCKEIGLTDVERRELAAFICATESGSLKDLDTYQVRRLCDALNGFNAVVTLLSLRPEL